MRPRDALLARIRGEFDEMPGLRLTSAQACRLWQIDAATCEAVIDTLLQEGFLTRTGGGTFIARSGSLERPAFPAVGAAERAVAYTRLRRGA